MEKWETGNAGQPGADHDQVDHELVSGGSAWHKPLTGRNGT